MFKKKPQIKNLSPLRSSDKRKLADQIIADYQITVPAPQTQGNTLDSTNAASSVPQPTLSTIRTSLLPDSTSSARFTTTAGPKAIPVSGTVYVGAHPGQDERILWIQSGKDPKLIPTVYTLWHNPNMVPLLHAADFVVEEKLKAGADLMTPGLVKVKSRIWDERATKGAIVAVAGISKDTVPVWVGTCEIDVSQLANDLRGTKGAAVKGIHWEGDELWNWSSIGAGGKPAPDGLESWDGIYARSIEQVGSLALDEDDDDDDDDDNDDDGEAQADGGVSLEDGPAIPHNGTARDRTEINVEHIHAPAKHNEDEDEQEPTTDEIDNAFQQALLYSLHNAKKQNEPPGYGFDFPIQPSFLIANMIQPHLRTTSQHYTIKKTSWKNTKKFIKHFDKQRLLKSKDRNGGETVILDIDFNDQHINDFQPYKLPKPKPKSDGTNGDAPAAAPNGDISLNQKLSIQTLYRLSSKLVPYLLPSKTHFYNAQQITSALKTYIENNPDLSKGVSTSRNIKLDPFIANHVLGSNSSSADQQVLRVGEIDRGTLNRRILDDDHLCIPYHVILRNDQSYDPENPSPDLKPKPGPSPNVTIVIEKRTGTKMVTKISNLEPFHINPQILGPELQKKCAGSASVGQLVGGKPGMMEIIVQGDQRDVVVKDVLAKRGINPKWVDIQDKSKGKGKKK